MGRAAKEVTDRGAAGAQGRSVGINLSCSAMAAEGGVGGMHAAGRRQEERAAQTTQTANRMPSTSTSSTGSKCSYAGRRASARKPRRA